MQGRRYAVGCFTPLTDRIRMLRSVLCMVVCYTALPPPPHLHKQYGVRDQICGFFFKVFPFIGAIHKDTLQGSGQHIHRKQIGQLLAKWYDEKQYAGLFFPVGKLPKFTLRIFPLYAVLRIRNPVLFDFRIPDVKKSGAGSGTRIRDEHPRFVF